MTEGRAHELDSDPVAAQPEMGETDAWGMVSTLVAGPIVWGLIGAGADALAGTDRLFLAVGVVVGFVASLYITYVRYGRSPAA